jgi:hypothetical protein
MFEEAQRLLEIPANSPVETAIFAISRAAGQPIFSGRAYSGCLFNVDYFE